MNQSPLPAELGQLELAYRAAPQSRLFAPLADAYHRAGRVDEALDVLQKGTREHPEYVSAWVLLGLCQQERSGSEAAEITFARVLALDPENLIALKHRAHRAFQGADLDTAAALVERVLEIDPYDREASRLRDEVASLRETLPTEGFDEVATVHPPAWESRRPLQAPATPESAEAEGEEPPILDLEELVSEEETPAPSAPASDAVAGKESGWQVQKDADRIVIRPRPEPGSAPPQTDEFSTMTLARIYESQGYDDKALAIYEALQKRDPENQELRERIRALQQRLGSRPAAPPSTEKPAERRWRLLDADKLGDEADQTAEQLRRLADRVRDREEGKRHTVIGRAPSATPPPAPAPDPVRNDEPDFERFLRYVRSLKR